VATATSGQEVSRSPLSGLRARPAAQFFVVLTRSVPGLATAWWVLLLVRSLVPAGLAVATGLLVGRVESGADLTTPLLAFGVVFVLSQVAPPVHHRSWALCSVTTSARSSTSD
jgi:ATP-binding cassette subfamily B protein